MGWFWFICLISARTASGPDCVGDQATKRNPRDLLRDAKKQRTASRTAGDVNIWTRSDNCFCWEIQPAIFGHLRVLCCRGEFAMERDLFDQETEKNRKKEH